MYSTTQVKRYGLRKHWYTTVDKEKYGRKRPCFTGLHVTVLRAYLEQNGDRIHSLYTWTINDRNTVTWKLSYFPVYDRACLT